MADIETIDSRNREVNSLYPSHKTSRHATYQPIFKLTVKKAIKLCLPILWRIADGLNRDWADAKVYYREDHLSLGHGL